MTRKLPLEMKGGKYTFEDILNKAGCGLKDKNGKRCTKNGNVSKNKCEKIDNKCRKKIKTQKKARTTKKTKSKNRSRPNMVCKCDIKRKYKGTEPSPKGLGHCAHCMPEDTIMKGRDGNMWRNVRYSKGIRWMKVKKV